MDSLTYLTLVRVDLCDTESIPHCGWLARLVVISSLNSVFDKQS